ncbi:MAG: hypothetical protein ACOYMA_15445 [Bacteroidia bacterium]
MRVKILLIISIVLSSLMVLSQSKNEYFSLSAGFGGTNYLNLGSTPHLNLKAQLKTNENGQAVFASFTYELPYQLNYQTEAVGKENGTIPNLIYVPYTIEYKYFNGTVNYLYNLSDDDDEAAKNYYYYLFGGLGASTIKNKYTIHDFDTAKYRIFYTDIIRDHNFIGLNIDLGAGINYNWNRFKFFSEGKMSLIQTFSTETFETNNKPNFSVSLWVGVGYIIIK